MITMITYLKTDLAKKEESPTAMKKILSLSNVNKCLNMKYHKPSMTTQINKRWWIKNRHLLDQYNKRV